jgi:hypothetical protein
LALFSDTISLSDKLSPNFTVASLSPTSTGISNIPTINEIPSLEKLANVLEKIMAKLGPATIASGYRSPAVNMAVGGSSTSRHMSGEALDIVPKMQLAEKYWAEILADDDLKNNLGEISFKKHQGSIHITLPYRNQFGFMVKASPRIADKESGRVIYRSITNADVGEFLSKYGLNITAKQAGIGLGLLALGAGAIVFAIALRRS